MGTVYILISFFVLGAIIVALKYKFNSKLKFQLTENEKELTLEKQRVFELAVSIGIGVLKTKPNGKITWVNPSLFNITGYQLSDLKGKNIENIRLVPESFEDSHLELFNSRKKTETIEIPISHKNGQLKWVSITCSFHYDYNGEITEVVELWTDITSDKRLEEEYNFILDNIGDIIYTADIQGHFTYVNTSTKEIIGYKRDDLLGKHFSTLVFEEDKAMVAKFYSNQFKTAKTHTVLDFRAIAKDGSVKWVQQSVKLNIHPKTDRIESFHAVVREITSQKEIESKYQFIIDNAKDGIYISDYKGFFTYANDSMKNILGFESYELVGKHFSDVIFEEDIQEVQKFYKNQLKGLEENTYFEFRVIDKYGRCKWVGQNVKSINSKEKGKIKEFHTIVRDITTRKVYEMELDRLSLVARKTQNIIIILNKEFKIEWVNDYFTELFEYTYHESLGKTPGELLNGPKTSELALNKINEDLASFSSVKAELVNYSKSKKEIWVEITMDPFVSADGEKGYIAVEQNISKRKEQERLINYQNQQIIDSINYSKRLQLSTIPNIKFVRDIIPNSFVWYQPKEIVSGDFYLVERLASNKFKDLAVFIVADCTGHGVPGAMLSVMCSSIIKQAINDESINQASEILDFTRNKLNSLLNSQYRSGDIKDGMDLGLGILDSINNKLHFSGANRPLWIIRGEEAIEIKGDRQPIGHYEKMFPFTNHEIEIKSGDSLYLFSDGICDQFGGEFGKKFYTRKFRELLVSLGDKEVDEKRNNIKTILTDWQGNYEQTDDICLMGINID